MIDSKASRFVFRKLAVAGAQRQVAIEIRRGTIDAEDRNILEQRREEDVVHGACTLQRAEAPGRRRAQDGPPPIAVVIHGVALQTHVFADEGEAQGERGCALQSEYDQRLTQVRALTP